MPYPAGVLVCFGLSYVGKWLDTTRRGLEEEYLYSDLPGTRQRLSGLAGTIASRACSVLARGFGRGPGRTDAARVPLYLYVAHDAKHGDYEYRHSKYEYR